MSLFAQPSGLQVEAGNVSSSSTNPNILNIQSSSNAILNWQDFSITQGECLQFIQESSKSTVLNRVRGHEASQLLGTLKSNGAVYVINPNGLFIGPNALIETAGFLASTADIPNDDFLNGTEFLFSSRDGEITNQGIIRCPEGDIIFIARKIKNEGSLEGNTINMISEREVLIRPKGQERILIRPITYDENLTKPFEHAINYASSQGDDFIIIDGILTAVSGEITLQGETVHLTENATLDVSGDVAGKIAVCATDVIIDNSAEMIANGYASDGGDVFIWGDFSTRFHGNISCQALGDQGNGGFAEVSAVEELYVTGLADMRSKNGEFGTLYFDPGPVTISSAVNAPPNTFNDAVLSTNLGAGNVTISTADGTLGGAETLTVAGSASVSWTAQTDLTLIGRRNVVIESGASITTTLGSMFIENIPTVDPTGAYDGISIGAATLSSTEGAIFLSAESGESASQTGISITDATIASVNGQIEITGIGNGTGTSAGLVITGASTRIGMPIGMTGDLSMVFSGFGSEIGSFGCTGISITDGIIQVVDGNLTFLGSGRGGVSSSQGVVLSSTVIESLGSGTITILGGGAAQGFFDCPGINALLGTFIRGTDGNIVISGTGGGVMTGGFGVGFFSGAGVVATGDASITITGLGSTNGTGTSPGVLISGVASNIAAGINPVTITGTGRGAGTSNQGIAIISGGGVTCSGTSDLIMTGTGAFLGTDSNQGIFVDGAGTDIVMFFGNCTLTGNGGGTGTSNEGIVFSDGAEVALTGGTFSCNGTGSIFGTTSCHGVNITGAATLIESTVANISITGLGGGFNIDSNHGIFINSSAIVRGIGTGSVTLNGTGSNFGTTTNNGVNITGAASAVTTVSGPISITGTGGGFDTMNDGIALDACTVSSTSGSITLDGRGAGTGGSNRGVNLTSAATVTCSGAGTLSVTGRGDVTGPDSWGVRVSGGTLSSTGSGGVSVVGFSMANTTEGILVEGASTVTSTGTGPISLRAFSDILVQNGGVVSSTASAPLTLTASNNLSVLGTTADAKIILTDGDGLFTFGGDMLIQGGAGFAQIGSDGPTATANMIFDINGKITVDGGATTGYALIGHGSPTSVISYSGNIRIERSRSLIDVNGANTGGGVQGFAQIGHLNSIGTLDGDFFINTNESIHINGGSAGATAYARIGHGGQGAGAVGSSIMELLAGININITDGVGTAQIVNAATSPGSGALTLIVDNLFPEPPGIGKGSFNLSSTLTATGELRVYSAVQENNRINSPINGQSYTAGVVGENDATHQWNVYFPGGTFALGSPFVFYFKEAGVIPDVIFNNIAATLTALENIIPLFEDRRLDIPFPAFHTKLHYDPKLTPYGSFIFEDYIYWIGLKWWKNDAI